MNKKEFIERFIVNWISTWSVTNYEKYIQNGWQEKLSAPPVSEALFLAEESWIYMIENNEDINSNNFYNTKIEEIFKE